MFRKQSNPVFSTARHPVRKNKIGFGLLLIFLLGLLSTTLVSAQSDVYLPLVTTAGTEATSDNASESQASPEAVAELPAETDSLPAGETQVATFEEAPVTAAVFDDTTLTVQNRVGIGTETPLGPLHINNEFGAPPNIQTSTDFGLLLGVERRAGYKWIQSYGGSLIINPGGNLVGIGTTNPNALLDVNGRIALRPGGNPHGAGIHLYGANVTAHRAFVGMDTENVFRIWASPLKKNGFAMNVNTGFVGINTDNPQARLDVAGTTRTDILQIDAGGDLAEPFDVTGTESVEPGMVVAIDPKHPGQLRIADKAYDRTVAGVVSGAGGINPGLILQQEGTEADGEHPVALTGRVYVWADATNGAIQPGDLLTTSENPGHAMKVNDHALAQGAILGKAMSALETGTGLVLILVSLQ